MVYNKGSRCFLSRAELMRKGWKFEGIYSPKVQLSTLRLALNLGSRIYEILVVGGYL